MELRRQRSLHPPYTSRMAATSGGMNLNIPCGLLRGASLREGITDRSFQYVTSCLSIEERRRVSIPRPKEFNPDGAVEKALHVFWHKGYEATSMEDLPTAMDLNRGSLSDTFGDKRQPFLKVIDPLHYLRRVEALSSINRGRHFPHFVDLSIARSRVASPIRNGEGVSSPTR
jgi:hypothetical protein